MSQRTTIARVQAILGADYGKLPDGSDPDLQQYIDTATVLVDRMATCATAKGYPLTAAELELVERWMSAHYYTRTDPTYTSRGTQGASGSFTQPKDDPERYRFTAIELDSSGCLDGILNRIGATAFWMGKTKSEQIDYDQRN